MEYLLIILVLIICIGLLANRELSHDKKRRTQIMREFSFKTYHAEDDGETHAEKNSGERES
ncbi:MAG: hypothetical protein AB1552_11225 [Nitrospirota bacterium]